MTLQVLFRFFLMTVLSGTLVSCGYLLDLSRRQLATISPPEDVPLPPPPVQKVLGLKVMAKTDSSLEVTDSLFVDVEIENDEGVKEWCLLDASVGVAATQPSNDDTCWVIKRPTSYKLSASGQRQVHLFVAMEEGITAPELPKSNAIGLVVPGGWSERDVWSSTGRITATLKDTLWINEDLIFGLGALSPESGGAEVWNVKRSTEGGTIWRESDIYLPTGATQASPRGLVRGANSRIIAYGKVEMPSTSLATIRFSDDKGVNWTGSLSSGTVAGGTSTELADVCPGTASAMIAVGRSTMPDWSTKGVFWISTDNGSTWNSGSAIPSVQTSSTADSCATDAQGRFYVLGTEQTGAVSAFWVKRYNPTTQTWETLEDQIQLVANMGFAWGSKLKLAVSSAGVVYFSSSYEKTSDSTFRWHLGALTWNGTDWILTSLKDQAAFSSDETHQMKLDSLGRIWFSGSFIDSNYSWSDRQGRLHVYDPATSQYLTRILSCDTELAQRRTDPFMEHLAKAWGLILPRAHANMMSVKCEINGIQEVAPGEMMLGISAKSPQRWFFQNATVGSGSIVFDTLSKKEGLGVVTSQAGTIHQTSADSWATLAFSDVKQLLRSVDGGKSWQQDKSIDSTFSLTGLSSFGNRFFLAGTNSILSRSEVRASVDDGQTWSVVRAGEPTASIQSFFASATNYYSYESGSTHKLWRSSDLGANWTALTLTGHEFSKLLVDSNTGVIWGVRSHSFGAWPTPSGVQFFRSTDGGVSLPTHLAAYRYDSKQTYFGGSPDGAVTDSLGNLYVAMTVSPPWPAPAAWLVVKVDGTTITPVFYKEKGVPGSLIQDRMNPGAIIALGCSYDTNSAQCEPEVHRILNAGATNELVKKISGQYVYGGQAYGAMDTSGHLNISFTATALGMNDVRFWTFVP